MKRELGRNALHLAVLSAFAFAEPLFDLLGKTPEFFVVRGSTAGDVVFFALVVAFFPPLAIVAVEAVVAWVSVRAMRWLHHAALASLAADVALQVVRKDVTGTDAAFAIAAVLGIAFAALSARMRGVQMFLTVLSPAPVIFVVIFLFRAPLGELDASAKTLTIPPPKNPVPVVLVVLDEFAEPTLMGPDHRIDAGRFPNFAALAATSTWYRNANSVHEHTPDAVPAILTGQNPKPGLLPVAQDHPDNIFTLLGSRYAMDAYESVTQLCPEQLCERRHDSFTDRITSLADDLEVVYGHLVLPKRLEERLPAVTNTWQNFSGAEHDDTAALSRTNLALQGAGDVNREIGRQMWQDQRFIWTQWVDGLAPKRKPTLYMMHLLMPHYPWRYLPDGKQYGSSLGIDGLGSDGDTWTTDPWVVEQGWQRHLLQAGFTDRLLGQLVAKLKAEGIWNKALVILTADHGVSFIPGQHRRTVTPANFSDIASIPLFVKLPHQAKGRIDDGDVDTTDIVPTIADELGLPFPAGYHVDGRSLLGPHGHRTVIVRGASGGAVKMTEAATIKGKYATLGRQLALFGSGSWTSVYDIGPNRQLIGRPVSSLPVTQGNASVSIDGRSLFADVDPTSLFSPGHVTGSVGGAPSGVDLAVAVNGTIEAVTQTFDSDGSIHFASFVPDTDFRKGANVVDVYAVHGGKTLERLKGDSDSTSAYTLSGTTLRGPAGTTIRIERGALVGRVEDWYQESATVRFGGWAGDAADHRLVDAVVVCQGSHSIFAGTTTVPRNLPQLQAKGQVEGGFVFELPRSLVGNGGGTPLRFFAVRGNVATELSYAPGFPWRVRQ
jgi:hypothetical protein